MLQDNLNEREFELINIVGANLRPNQRDLSRLMELSLGMVNILLRRLVAKGYIRINQLNKRKVEYLLTPKGFSEKMRKSFKYTLKTIHSIGVIKNRLKKVLQELVVKGERHFVILGESDFAVMVEMILREICHGQCHVRYAQEMPVERMEGILLICKELLDSDKEFLNGKVMNLVEELAKNYVPLED